MFWSYQASAWAHFNEDILNGKPPAGFATYTAQTSSGSELICVLPIVIAIAGIRMGRLMPRTSRQRKGAAAILLLAGFAMALWLIFNQPWAVFLPPGSHAVSALHYSDVYTSRLHRDAAIMMAITIIAAALIWVLQTRPAHEAAGIT